MVLKTGLWMCLAIMPVVLPLLSHAATINKEVHVKEVLRELLEGMEKAKRNSEGGPPPPPPAPAPALALAPVPTKDALRELLEDLLEAKRNSDGVPPAPAPVDTSPVHPPPPATVLATDVIHAICDLVEGKDKHAYRTSEPGPLPPSPVDENDTLRKICDLFH